MTRYYKDPLKWMHIFKADLVTRKKSQYSRLQNKDVNIVLYFERIDIQRLFDVIGLNYNLHIQVTIYL